MVEDWAVSGAIHTVQVRHNRVDKSSAAEAPVATLRSRGTCIMVAVHVTSSIFLRRRFSAATNARYALDRLHKAGSVWGIAITRVSRDNCY